MQKLAELYSELNDRIFDYTAHPGFWYPGLLYDMSHLKQWEAKMFSDYLTKVIATILKEQNQISGH